MKNIFFEIFDFHKNQFRIFLEIFGFFFLRYNLLFAQNFVPHWKKNFR